MPPTQLNMFAGMDYQRVDAGLPVSGLGRWTAGLTRMKFSTRIDTDLPADALFDIVSDFNRIERMLMHRGTRMVRIDPAQEPGTGIGWHIGFDWRGRPREMRLEVTRFDRPEVVGMTGESEAFDTDIRMTVVALSLTRSRLIFETDIRPRNMRARLMLQTAKLGKPQLDRKFERRISDFLSEMRAA